MIKKLAIKGDYLDFTYEDVAHKLNEVIEWCNTREQELERNRKMVFDTINPLVNQNAKLESDKVNEEKGGSYQNSATKN